MSLEPEIEPVRRGRRERKAVEGSCIVLDIRFVFIFAPLTHSRTPQAISIRLRIHSHVTKGAKRIKSRMQTNTLMMSAVVVVVVVPRRLTSITQNKLDSLCPLQVTPLPPPAPLNHIQIRIQNQNQNRNENQSRWLFINCQLFFLLPPAFIIVVYVSLISCGLLRCLQSLENKVLYKKSLQILCSFFSVLNLSSTLI